MMKRTKEPWMDADDFGRSLPQGIGLNLLVADIPRSVAFQTQVLGATVVYEDEDFAVLSGQGSIWMLHADHTYLDHPMTGVIGGVEARGAGAELRLHGRNPDDAEAAAREAGYTVLAGAMDKPHGLREAYIIDDDGYVWVPDLPLGA